MDKKGFTLVELLAVIAILAILVILALSNVLEMFNRAKKEIFLTEAKTIYKEVAKKYITENMKGNKISNVNSKNTKLDLDNDGYEYNIKLDNKGNVKRFNVSNDSFCIKAAVSNVNDITIDMISDEYCDVFDYSPNPTNCTYDGELVQGAEYTYDGYTYRYNQIFVGTGWSDRNANGWGVTLTDKESTSPVNGKICTYINNKPVVYASSMFNGSKATSIDLTSFNTKNIVDMGNMFNGAEATEIKGLDTFNTSNVTTMGYMFSSSQVDEIDLSNFDTSNVVYMGYMFYNSKATILDLSSFDTSKVTYMAGMFKNSEALNLDLNNFDTSNVVNMDTMFNGSKAIKLNVSNFNTSKVVNMQNMFNGSFADELNLSNFNTSNVTNMYGMFWNSKAKTINTKSFDTSNVTNMSVMFWDTNTDIIDVSNFNTSNVIQMEGMFRGSKASKIVGLESFDTSKVTNMFNMFNGSSVIELDLSSFDTSSVIRADNIFNDCRKLKTIYASEKFKINDDVEGNSIFWACDNLVGGEGTKYSSSNPIDKTYARIDGGTSSPGYFTVKR